MIDFEQSLFHNPQPKWNSGFHYFNILMFYNTLNCGEKHSVEVFDLANVLDLTPRSVEPLAIFNKTSGMKVMMM